MTFVLIITNLLTIFVAFLLKKSRNKFSRQASVQESMATVLRQLNSRQDLIIKDKDSEIVALNEKLTQILLSNADAAKKSIRKVSIPKK